MNKDEVIFKSIEDREKDYYDFNELEKKLENDLNSHFSELEFLKEKKEEIGDTKKIGETVTNIVWEQFLNQLASVAGDDFIRENRGLRLDLRDDAHIQTTENFANGKISTHNTEINYKERYENWQDNFVKNSDGVTKETWDKRTNTHKKTLKSGARAEFDKDRATGTNTVHKDHTVSTGEMIRDPKANAHLDKNEQIRFANCDKNLVDLDSRANSSKGDSKMEDWLNSERNGEKPADRFNINEEELRKQDQIAREEYEKLKQEGEKKSIETGKKSQREEAFKIGGKALRTFVMQLFAELIKEIFSKLILWFKSAVKGIETLIKYIKSAILSFVSKLKIHLINTGSSIITTIAQAIFGPIVTLVRKTITLLRQGWKSLKESIDYLKNSENKNKSIGILIAEIGKIIITGISGAGAITLGEIIEKSLITIPFLAIEIPFLGSLANIIGLFSGALTAGIIGAIALNLIDKFIANQQKKETTKDIINVSNKVLNLQQQLIINSEKKLEQSKNNLHDIIKERHHAAAEIIKDTLENIHRSKRNDEIILSDNETDFNEMKQLLNELF